MGNIDVLELTKEEYAALLEEMREESGTTKDYEQMSLRAETLSKTIANLQKVEQNVEKPEKKLVFGRFDPDKCLFVGCYVGVAILGMVFESGGHMMPMKFLGLIKPQQKPLRIAWKTGGLYFYLSREFYRVYNERKIYYRSLW